jgi:hypothetical protein
MFRKLCARQSLCFYEIDFAETAAGIHLLPFQFFNTDLDIVANFFKR